MAAQVLTLIAGLFFLTLLQFGRGASQEIPDDKVYTELKKTLIHGSSGILTCRFTGSPYAVYWKKGHDPWNSPILMTWTPEAKTGPRYEDGSCDMTENYSLVIKTVNDTDTGRYICFVSNQYGILIDNHTDVTVTDVALKTKSVVTLEVGNTGTVPCQVNIRPKKVSWVTSTNADLVFIDLSHGVIERSGPGYEERLFNITKEYSLVIYDVTIKHEDYYFCEVIDYDTGSVYQDATALNVFAYPREPFPYIGECPANSSSSCSLRISSDTTLTCQVEEYYPNMDLHFVRGSERVQSLETKIWNNNDGTKNKRIRITADGGADSSFECVATGFVGRAFSRSMTIHLIRGVPQSSVNVVTAVVPVILVSAIIVVAAVYVSKRRKRHMKRKYEMVSMVYKARHRDLISYIELWTLVMFAREQHLSEKLLKVLDKLVKDEDNSKTLQTNEDYYEEFCKWKAGYTGTCQRKDFFDACLDDSLKSTIGELQNYSDSTRAVTADDLEHLLWHIGEIDSIIAILKDLGARRGHLKVLKDKGEREVVEGAMNILKQWRDDDSSGNQEVRLSLALETIKHPPSDVDFYRIPDWKKRGLDKNEIQEFLSPLLTSRHCTELINATKEFRKKYSLTITFSSKIENILIDNIIEENRTALFDSHRMIEDWWAEQNCSNYEKRCRLWRAANVHTERTDNLEINVPNWDDPMRDHTHRHCEESEITAKQGLLSRPRGKHIYERELINVALDLIMEDFRPFAKALGIGETKFTSYRQEYHASHIGLGTISLVTELFNITKSDSLNETKRKSFSRILDKAGYPNVMKSFLYFG